MQLSVLLEPLTQRNGFSCVVVFWHCLCVCKLPVVMFFQCLF